MRRVLLPLGFLAVFVALPLAQDQAYRANVERWRGAQDASLRSDDGWLTVVGLSWLRPGANVAGSGEKSDIRLPPSAPATVGVFTLDGQQVRFEPRHDSVRLNNRRAATTVLGAGGEGQPDAVTSGSLTLLLIRRGDRVGIRVKDRDSEARRDFKGRRWYPIDESWRVVARFVPHDPPKTIPILNVLGQVSDQPSPGYVVFAVGGKEYRLDPTGEPGGTLFFNFRDATSGDGTYPAGRFLYTDAPRDGRVVLDFNKAESPPCAFTEHATCPLPPRQNSLRIRVDAGEKY